MSTGAVPVPTQILRAAVRVDRSKLALGTGARNALGVCLPLVAGLITGYRTEGIVMAGSALLVGFCDLGGPFVSRARTLLAGSLLAGVSTTVGTWTGNSDVLTVLLMTVWGFVAGFAVAFSRQTAFVTLNAALALLIAADFPLPLDDALRNGALAAAGGLVQTFLALVVWPVRPHRPELRAVVACYRALAAPLEAPAPTAEQVAEAQAALDAARAALLDVHGLAFVRSQGAEALRALLDVADRLYVELIGLAEARERITAGQAAERAAPPLDALLADLGALLRAVAVGLDQGRVDIDLADARARLDAHAGALRAAAPAGGADVEDALALFERARAALRTAGDAATAPDAGLARMRTPEQPVLDGWESRRRRPSPLVVLRANLTAGSLAFQHALRLGLVLGVAVTIYRVGGLGRGYWVPLTVLFVLRPDFATTFTRGAQRYAGTALGIVVATVLVALTDPGDGLLVALIAVFATGVYAFFYANYGMFTVSVTATIVFLVSLGGAPELTAALDRGIDTAIGAALALAAWALWPTWESDRLPETLADLLDADRAYLGAVLAAHCGRLPAPGAMEAARDRALVSRANAEESLQRVLAEPVRVRAGADTAAGVLAESRRLALSAIAAEAHVRGPGGSEREALAGLDGLAGELDRALAAAAAAARGSTSPQALPPLRDGLAALGAREPAMAAEAERIVAATEAIHQLLTRGAPAPAPAPAGAG